MTAEKLGQSIQKFLNSCARKTGIEKALVLRRGIKKIHYSKTAVLVEFVSGPWLDGKMASDAAPSAAALRAAPPAQLAAAPK